LGKLRAGEYQTEGEITKYGPRPGPAKWNLEKGRKERLLQSGKREKQVCTLREKEENFSLEKEKRCPRGIKVEK